LANKGIVWAVFATAISETLSFLDNGVWVFKDCYAHGHDGLRDNLELAVYEIAMDCAPRRYY